LVKASYFYLRRVFSPVLASFRSNDDRSVELWITNDMLSAISEHVTVRLETFDGTLVWQTSVPVNLPARQSRPIAAWTAERLGPANDRYLAVRSPSDTFPSNRHFFAPIKELRRPKSDPTMTITSISPHELHVELAGAPDAYALFVHLLVPHESTRFSDNYLDLAPGEVRVVTVTNPVVRLDPETVTLGWR